MEVMQHLQERINELEVRWMQLQQDVETLNAVILSQQREMESWRAAFLRLENRLESLSEQEPPRDPLAERPPHY